MYGLVKGETAISDVLEKFLRERERGMAVS